MKTPEDKFKADVEKICTELKWRLGLTMWNYTIIWSHHEHKESHVANKTVNAEITVCEAYLTFTITLYRNMFLEWQEDGREKTIEHLAHEFIHVLIDPMYQYAHPQMPDSMTQHFHELRERTVSYITRLMINQHGHIYQMVAPKPELPKSGSKRQRPKSKARPSSRRSTRRAP